MRMSPIEEFILLQYGKLLFKYHLKDEFILNVCHDLNMINSLDGTYEKWKWKEII